MTAEEKVEIVEEYRDDFKMLKEIVEKAEEIHHRNSSNIEVQSYMESVIENAKEATAELAKDFAENEMLDEESQPEKLGYSFTWLRKLKSAADDAETEKILQDWLAELAHKKSAEND